MYKECVDLLSVVIYHSISTHLLKSQHSCDKVYHKQEVHMLLYNILYFRYLYCDLYSVPLMDNLQIVFVVI